MHEVNMVPGGVSLKTVERLTVYRKVLSDLADKGTEYVFSHRLASLASVTPAQLRRDLASFGSFGNVARGYHVRELSETIGRLLGTDSVRNVILIGVGNLGKTLLTYRGFEERGFRIVAAFDRDSEKTDRTFAGRRIYRIDQLESALETLDAHIAILACGPSDLNELVSRLASAGVHHFLNFVPVLINRTPDIFVEDVDISAKLEKLSFIRTNGRAQDEQDE